MQYLLKIRLQKNNSRLYLILLHIIASVLLILLYKRITTKKIKKHFMLNQNYTTNISCHYSVDDDALPSAEDPTFAPSPKSIFFHETSCQGRLTSRQACAVEAAAKAHPHWHINVLFSSPVTANVLNNSCISKLLEHPNVRISRVHILDYCQHVRLKSFVQEFFNDTNWNRTSNSVEYISEILRFVTLKRWGGVYLDLNMLVVRSLESLAQNWIVRLNKRDVATQIISFGNDPVASAMIDAILDQLSSSLDPYVSASEAILRVIRAMCPRALISPKVDYCGNEISVYSSDMFFPVTPSYWYVYYAARNLPDLDAVYTHHLWRNVRQHSPVDKDSPYAKLAQKYCPDIYNYYGDDFGL